MKCCYTDAASPCENQLLSRGAVCAAKVTESEGSLNAEIFTNDALCAAQDADETIAPIKDWRPRSTSRPDWKLLENHNDDVRTLWAQFESLEVRNGILYRRFYRNDGTVSHLQLILPRVLHNTFLKLVHEGAGGHFAVSRTQDQVQRRAYWPRWRQSVEYYIRRCLTCAQSQSRKPKRQGMLQSFEANGPADRYSIDLVGPYPRTKRGKKYILTVLDAYTRHLTTIALSEKSAPAVARALVHEVFMKIGYPRSLLSDLGTEFQNQVLDGICRVMGAQKLKTTVHRPSANGRCERSHHTTPTPLQLPLGLTASAIAGAMYYNHHLSARDLSRHLEVTLGAGQQLTEDKRALLDSHLDVAIASERRLAAALDSIQDLVYGAPELHSEAPKWIAAIIRAVMKRPS